MNKLTFVAATGVTSVALAAAIVSPAFAWHPQGKIVKSVQNLSDTSSTLSDANTDNTAVAAKPGDILRYVIVVSNVADQDKSGGNDMAFTSLTDTLPAGVELVSSASTRQINEDLGTIKPGESKTKEYQVKVTAQKDGVIKNEACFDGNSTVKDNEQKGCDSAIIKVTVPPVTPAPVTPTPTPVPVTPTPVQPATLPNTGPADIIALAGIAAAAGYALNVLRLKFRTNR